MEGNEPLPHEREPVRRVKRREDMTYLMRGSVQLRTRRCRICPRVALSYEEARHIRALDISRSDRSSNCCRVRWTVLAAELLYQLGKLLRVVEDGVALSEPELALLDWQQPFPLYDAVLAADVHCHRRGVVTGVDTYVVRHFQTLHGRARMLRARR